MDYTQDIHKINRFEVFFYNNENLEEPFKTHLDNLRLSCYEVVENTTNNTIVLSFHDIEDNSIYNALEYCKEFLFLQQPSTTHVNAIEIVSYKSKNEKYETMEISGLFVVHVSVDFSWLGNTKPRHLQIIIKDPKITVKR